MKRFAFILAVIFAFVSCAAVPVSAAEDPSVGVHGTIDFANIENNPDVSVSEVMTFTEMVEHYAMNAGITYEDALLAFPNMPNTRAVNDIYYRVLSVTLNVTEEYHPRLEFYCETAEGGNFRNINAIYSVQLVRSYNGLSKQYSGVVEVWLRSSYAIEYTVNGDFYNNGVTNITGGGEVEIGIDQIAKIKFNVSGTYESSHYQYFYEHETAYYGNP